MSDNILLIANSSSPIRSAFGSRVLEYNNQSRDEEIHSWILINRDAFNGIEKIIIPARLSKDDATFMGIYIALHLRLTKELGAARFLPIAILSESSREEILLSQLDNFSEKTALLLFTKGTYLYSGFDVEDQFIKVQVSSSDEGTLREELKSKLVFNTPDRGHDLANEWGAFRLAKYAGVELTIPKPASIFFKFKDFLSNNEIQPSGEGKTILLEKNCNALLIDDRADSGWFECVDFILRKKIISFTKIRSLTAIKNYTDASKVSNFKDYDLILLDLRLLPQEDKANELTVVSEFSGAKILKKIKEENRGTQVIIFTASNKVWNIQSLLDLGANGYYIKESPEFVLSASFSLGNYNSLVNSIKRCLNQSHLREIWEYHIKCNNFIMNDKIGRNAEYKDFYNRTQVSLEIAFELLNKSSGQDKYLNFAFLTYFQILEDYVRMEENFKEVSSSECYVSGGIRVIDQTASGQRKWNLEHKAGGYFIVNNSLDPKEMFPKTLSRVSFVLAYKFNKNDQFLRKWGGVNSIRNEKAAHGGDEGYVSISDLFDVIKIVELFLTNS